MNDTTRWLLSGVLLLAACGGDDDGGDTPGGGNGGGSGTQAPGSGSGGSGTAGGSGSNVSTAGTGGGSGSASGAGGGSGAGQSGTGAGGSSGTGASDSGVDDSGTDSGTPPGGTVCTAPNPDNNPTRTCPAGAAPTLSLTLIKDSLDVPIFVAQAPGDDTRLFVVERGGTILLIDPDDGTDLGEFMTVPSVAASGSVSGEMGLLGFAFHPDYPTDPRFFVNYTADQGGLETVVASFEVMGSDPDQGDASSGMPLLRFDQPEGNHNGGSLAFGPDGCLFVGTGDGGGSDDMHGATGNGQNLSTELGKILRLDVDDPTNGAPGNLAGAGSPHIWDYGIRNAWRMSFDRMTGDLWIGDVGQGAREEISVSPRGVGGVNWGWKIMEGAICRPGGGGSCDMNGLELPLTDHDHSGGDDCVVGGYVYRGSAIPGLQGYYVYGDNGPGRRIRVVAWDGDGTCGDPVIVSERDNLTLTADITSFGEDDAGELYVTTSTSVYRIDSP